MVGRDEKRDGPDDTLARTDTGEVAIDFLPRRSHQLIATPITPRLPPRSVVPACRFAWALCSISPLDLSCLGSFLFYRFVPAHLVLSLSRPALLPCLSLSRLAPSMAAKGAGKRGRQRGFSLRAVFLSSLSFVLSSGSHHRGGLDGRDHLIISSSHPSGSSYSSPLSHLITERRRWCLSSFKQATTAWRPSPRFIISSHHLIPSSHPIPVMERLARRLVSWRLVGHLVPIYRVINGGRDENEASKRTRKNGEGTGTRKRVVGRGEGRNENGNTTGTGRWQHKNGKQASKQDGGGPRPVRPPRPRLAPRVGLSTRRSIDGKGKQNAPLPLSRNGAKGVQPLYRTRVL